MQYNKLVRDKIPERIVVKGETCKFHTASDDEYWLKLKEKLREEVAEFCADESIGELADLLEVIDAIVVYKKFNRDEIQQTKQKKSEERGNFEKRIILDES